MLTTVEQGFEKIGQGFEKIGGYERRHSQKLSGFSKNMKSFETKMRDIQIAICRKAAEKTVAEIKVEELLPTNSYEYLQEMQDDWELLETVSAM